MRYVYLRGDGLIGGCTDTITDLIETLKISAQIMQVMSEIGFKIPAGTPTQVVQDMSATMLQSDQNPAVQSRLGLAGQQQVKEFYNWQTGGQQINQLYEKLVRSSPVS